MLLFYLIILLIFVRWRIMDDFFFKNSLIFRGLVFQRFLKSIIRYSAKSTNILNLYILSISKLLTTYPSLSTHAASACRDACLVLRRWEDPVIWTSLKFCNMDHMLSIKESMCQLTGKLSCFSAKETLIMMADLLRHLLQKGPCAFWLIEFAAGRKTYSKSLGKKIGLLVVFLQRGLWFQGIEFLHFLFGFPNFYQ